MKDLVAKIEAIRQQSNLLVRDYDDTVELDRALGEVETLVHNLRQEIDDEWRAARTESARHYRPPARSPTFEEATEDLS